MFMQVSDAALRENEALRAWLDRWMRATPEERAEWAERARHERAAERRGAVVLPVTVERLLDKMGWSMAYAEHLMRPYCTCGPNGTDGEWEWCAHAVDLGIEVYSS